MLISFVISCIISLYPLTKRSYIVFKPCPSLRTPHSLDNGDVVFYSFHQPLLESRGVEVWRKVPGFPYSVSNHERVRRDAATMQVGGAYNTHTRTAHIDRRHSSPNGTVHFLCPFYLGPRRARYAAVTLSIYGFQYTVPIFVMLAAVGFVDQPEHASRLPKPPRRPPLPTVAVRYVPKQRKRKPPPPIDTQKQHELALARREAIKQKFFAKRPVAPPPHAP